MNREFLDRVQAHERLWGSEQYASRPNLAEILGAKVVAFWLLRSEPAAAAERPVISLHNDLSEIEAWYLHAVTRMHVQLPDRRLAAVYVDHAKVRVKSVKIEFDIPARD